MHISRRGEGVFVYRIIIFNYLQFGIAAGRNPIKNYITPDHPSRRPLKIISDATVPQSLSQSVAVSSLYIYKPCNFY